jgi:copper chaperone NosL
MVISDARTAGQVVSRDGGPLFFDDLGCMRTWIDRERSRLGADTAVYVADHRTGAWVPAAQAVFVSSSRVETPMGSGLLAYADKASLAADAAAAPFIEVSRAHVLGAASEEQAR